MQEKPFNNYNDARSKKRLLYIIFLAIIPTIVVTSIAYMLIGYVTLQYPLSHIFITGIVAVCSFIIAMSLVDLKIVGDENKRFNIARTLVGNERYGSSSDFVAKSLEFLDQAVVFTTDKNYFKIGINEEILVCVCKTVNMHTICNARITMKEKESSNICIVISDYSYKQVSPKAKKLADKYDMQIVNYSDILNTIYDKMEPDNFDGCEE